MRFDRWKGLALGVLAAVGGFVDMGGIIFVDMGGIITASQAGARYRFALLWTLIPGVIGLIVYADMSGRVVIASGRTLFDVIRSRLGFRLAAIPLVATAIVNTLTLVIELAGMTLALELATRVGYLLWFPVAALFLVIILWKARFDLRENGSALLGLSMLVSVAAMVKLAPPWGQIGAALVHPTVPAHTFAPYLLSVIGLLGAYMIPYQFYFYSSGAVEEEWSGKDPLVNRVTSIAGSCFGAVVDLSLIYRSSWSPPWSWVG